VRVPPLAVILGAALVVLVIVGARFGDAVMLQIAVLIAFCLALYAIFRLLRT
jgi:hypothetical protein